LAVDLDGGGVNTTPVSTTAGRFDLTGWGHDVDIAWLAPGDGWIVSDDNGNGRIDHLGEMLGNELTDGFVELARFDTDANGVVDARDDGFARLSVWVDANSNRRTDVGELSSLADTGVSALSLKVTNREVFEHGNRIARHGVALVNGVASPLADVELRYDVSAAWS